MEWLTPSQINPFHPADIICTLCEVCLSLGEWPRHVWTADHQNRAYPKCALWSYFDRRNIFVIYCNIPVQPVSFMEYLRNKCRLEVKDFILVPGKPTIAILQFHSSKEYMEFLYHSMQIRICCEGLIVTHATPATGISYSGWTSLVKYEGPKLTFNGISPISPTSTSVSQAHSPIPGPSSSGSSHGFPGCPHPQGHDSVRRLHQLAIESGWPPPQFERQINDRRLGEYTAKVTVNGRSFRSKIPVADYSTACKIVADTCLKGLEKGKRKETFLKFDYDGNAYEDLCRLVKNRKWSISGTTQYKRQKNSGKGEIYFYSLLINEEEHFSPIGGTTRDEGISQLSAYCLKTVFNITRHAQTIQPSKIAPLQKPADNRHCSAVPSSSSSSIRPPPPPKPHPSTTTRSSSKTHQNSNATPTLTQTLNFQRPQNSQYHSPLSGPAIAAKIPQPVKRKIEEQPVLSTDRHHPIKRGTSLTGNNKISATEELMELQLARSNQMPTLCKHLDDQATNFAASTSSSKIKKTNKNLKPEIEVVYDDTKQDEHANEQPPKILDDEGEILLVREVWKKSDEDKQNTMVKVKTEKYTSPWPQYFLPEEYIKSLKHPVDTLDKICLVCNWKKPSYDLVVSQTSTEEGGERFSYKMKLNGIHYENERVERTKKMAQNKVAKICLTTLAHNGEIPHPSVFMNVSLNRVRRLENLIISRRLPKRSQDEPQYTMIKDRKSYYSEVTLNGEYYISSKSAKTEKEAKTNAAAFFLKKLSSSIPLFADGSFTEKAKTVLMTMSTEIPKTTVTDKGLDEKENLKNQCKNICSLMEITKEEMKSAKAIVRNMKKLVPGLKAILYKNWYLKLKSYTDYDRLFIFAFKTGDDEIKAADPKEIENNILQSSERFPGLTVTDLANTNSAKYFKQSAQNFESKPSFVLETDLNTLDEVHLCRLIHYMSEFDSRFLPILSLLRYWAKINEVRFQSLDNSTMKNIWGDPFILDLLLVNFLGATGVIPTVRELLERKNTFSFRASKICLPSDITYANEWKSNGHTYKENSVEFWLSVLVLTKNFFVYYADRFKEGSWVFNICDSEMIYCLDLFYGSFHTKLSPEKLKKLVKAKGLNRKKIEKHCDSNDSQMYMMIPMQTKSKRWTNLNWKRMVNEMMECGSWAIFDLMSIAGTRLTTFLNDFPQSDLDIESTLNCLP